MIEEEESVDAVEGLGPTAGAAEDGDHEDRGFDIGFSFGEDAMEGGFGFEVVAAQVEGLSFEEGIFGIFAGGRGGGDFVPIEVVASGGDGARDGQGEP